MKAAGLLLLVGLIGGCGDGGPANRTQPAPTKVIAAPIDNGSAANETVTETGPSPTATPLKPLVSRETLPPRAPDYRAIGTEPFWAVTIRGSMAILERPDQAPLRFAVRADGDDRAVRYQGDGFTMTLTPGPCSDGMSDAIWSDRVQVAFGDGTLKGCGGLREDGGEDAP